MLHRHSRCGRGGRFQLFGATALTALATTLGFAALSRASADAPDIVFSVQQPNGAMVCVQFNSGVSSIVQQDAFGSNLLEVFTSDSGFCVYGRAVGGEDDATVQVLVLANASTIDANGQVQGSSSLSYSIGGGASTSVGNGDFSIPVPLGLSAGRHYSPVLRVRPGPVQAGHTVTISGIVSPQTAAGRTVTLLSNAFSARHTIMGVPAATAKVRKNGRYSATVTIPIGRKPGGYAVTAQLGTRLMGIATLRVRR